MKSRGRFSTKHLAILSEASREKIVKLIHILGAKYDCNNILKTKGYNFNKLKYLVELYGGDNAIFGSSQNLLQHITFLHKRVYTLVVLKIQYILPGKITVYVKD